MALKNIASRVKVKICGQTSVEDCEMSVKHGADFLGVVLDVDWSPRSLSVWDAVPIFSVFGSKTFLLTFNREVDGVLLEAVASLKPCALQLTGQEPVETVAKLAEKTGLLIFKSIHLRPEGEGNADDVVERAVALMRSYTDAGAGGFVLDTASKGMYGGTGVKSDWGLAARVVAESAVPVFIAGGINPENVAMAAAIPGIYGVDLASGVEFSKGKKSEEKLAALFDNFRQA